MMADKKIKNKNHPTKQSPEARKNNYSLISQYSLETSISYFKLYVLYFYKVIEEQKLSQNYSLNKS